MKVRLHAIEQASRANGPGLRAVIWFQGCSLRCPGCFNPETHNLEGGFEANTAQVAEDILSSKERTGIEGVTFSGGEPFEQAVGLLDLIRRLRGASSLTLLAFSGFTRPQLEACSLGRTILRLLDVLVAGPYLRNKQTMRGLLTSSNQRLHLLSRGYTPADFYAVAGSEAIVHRDGSVTLSGLGRPLDLARPIARPPIHE